MITFTRSEGGQSENLLTYGLSGWYARKILGVAVLDNESAVVTAEPSFKYREPVANHGYDLFATRKMIMTPSRMGGIACKMTLT